MNKKIFWVIVVVLVMLGIFYIIFRQSNFNAQLDMRLAEPEGGMVASGTLRVVATENFYGDIAKQLGGDRVFVTSILSDPNIDPHEYEPNVRDGIAIANANIVVENGLQYDTWMDKLLFASPNPDRTVIVAGDIAPRILPKNPHIWYDIDNMEAVGRSIAGALEKADPAHAAVFENNLAAFEGSLSAIAQKIDEIKSHYGGTPVALTETIYLYQTQSMELTVLTPVDFEEAIAEGNDPSAQSVNITNREINNKEVKVLIYNNQTVTPITTNLVDMAQSKNIPVVYITETMPENMTYQMWMTDQVNALESALMRATNNQ